MTKLEKIKILKADFEKLALIEQTFSMLGSLTFEEQKTKTEILNK